MQSTLAHLERYRGLGFSVIPIVPPGHGHDGKHPALPWKKFQAEHATNADLADWFTTPMSIGIVTGAISGIVVIDLDSIEAKRWATSRLPYTPWQQKTPRGGFHLLYRHPGSEIRNRAKLDMGAGKIALDCRGDGGYIVAAPSQHANGGRYQLVGDWSATLLDLPVFEPGWIARPAPAPDTCPRPARVSSTPVLERARKYLASIPPPVIGQGSDAATLYAACRLVRGFDIGERDAAALLWDWAGQRPGWTRLWIDRKVQHALRYGTEPVGGLR